MSNNELFVLLIALAFIFLIINKDKCSTPLNLLALD